jgi:hypothetical protein
LDLPYRNKSPIRIIGTYYAAAGAEGRGLPLQQHPTVNQPEGSNLVNLMETTTG